MRNSATPTQVLYKAESRCIVGAGSGPLDGKWSQRCVVYRSKSGSGQRLITASAGGRHDAEFWSLSIRATIRAITGTGEPPHAGYVHAAANTEQQTRQTGESTTTHGSGISFERAASRLPTASGAGGSDAADAAGAVTTPAPKSGASAAKARYTN